MAIHGQDMELTADALKKWNHGCKSIKPWLKKFG
jgi:hypothetical protein